MEASELRIGNYVRGASRGEITKVTSGIITLLDERRGVYNPIELTEEWLEKHGFEYDEEVKTFDLLYSLTKYDFCFTIHHHDNEFYLLMNDKRIWINYIHELQNLFFAIIGEELLN